jgi:hypothetical protein
MRAILRTAALPASRAYSIAGKRKREANPVLQLSCTPDHQRSCTLKSLLLSMTPTLLTFRGGVGPSHTMASVPILRMDPPPRSPRRRCAWLVFGPNGTTEYKVVGAGLTRATEQGFPRSSKPRGMPRCCENADDSFGPAASSGRERARRWLRHADRLQSHDRVFRATGFPG